MDASLANLRCILLARCSTAGQSEDSIPQQLAILRQFASSQHMQVVDEVRLEGLSVSGPFEREDLSKLRDRRIRAADYDAILVQDWTRLTRREVEDGQRIISEFNDVGVQIISVLDGVANGELAWLINGLKLHQGRQEVRNLAFRTARGTMAHIVSGELTYTMRVPYGVDRLYVNGNEKPLYILRNLGDGRQEKLDPKTMVPLCVYERNEKKMWRHNIKQAEERVTLIKGHPDTVEVVRNIFRRRFVDLWGYYRIARELNELGIPAARGGDWNQCSVDGIVRNPCYVGRGFTNRSFRGKIVGRDLTQPRFLGRSASDLESKCRLGTKRTTLPDVPRPRHEWYETKLAGLEDYLDAGLREIVWTWQSEQFDRNVKGRAFQRGQNSYFLTGILRSKQGNHPMSGSTSRPAHGVYRYYKVSRSRSNPTSDTSLKRWIAADPLEQAIVKVVEGLFSCDVALRSEVSKVVGDLMREVKRDSEGLEALRAERQTVEDKIKMAFEDFGTLSREIIRRQTAKLGHQYT